MAASSASAGAKLMDRVARQVRVGHVALHALAPPGARQRAAAAVLHHVAHAVHRSGLAHDAGVQPLAAGAAAPRTTCTVPCSEGPSSSLVSRKATVPAWPGWAARTPRPPRSSRPAVFMSAAPRPYRRPSRWRGHEGVAGPALQRAGGHHVGVAGQHQRRPGPAAAVHGPQVGSRGLVGPGRQGFATKPAAASRSASRAWQPPSAGVTERQAISASVRRRASFTAGRPGRCRHRGWRCAVSSGARRW
jgi:hypothetical protein